MLTGPTRSGTIQPHNATFPSMKKKPMSVTMFGASHSGNNSTKAFHYGIDQRLLLFFRAHMPYVVLEDIFGEVGFVDAAVLVGL